MQHLERRVAYMSGHVANPEKLYKMLVEENQQPVHFKPVPRQAPPAMQPRSYNNLQVNSATWKIPDVYCLNEMQFKNSGSSIVLLAQKPDKTRVTIKNLTRSFDTLDHAKQMYREIVILSHMHHGNVIELYDLYTPMDQAFFNDIYLVQPLMDFDLKWAIETFDLSENLRIYAYQIARGLKYLHSTNLIHRDLKPASIGLTKDHHLRILDFGMARIKDPISMTSYTVTTPMYRSPEVWLGSVHYDERVDIWSFGCILVEMINQRPLMKDHSQDLTQYLNRCVELLGRPGPHYIPQIGIDDSYFVTYLNSRLTQGQLVGNLVQTIQSTDQQLIDLILQCLMWDWESRLLATDLVQHPYFRELHNEAEEPLCQRFTIEHEFEELSIDQYKDLVWNKIIQFQQEHNPIG